MDAFVRLSSDPAAGNPSTLRRRQSVPASVCSEALKNLGPDRVLCVLSCTASFAPRQPDDLPAIARVSETRLLRNSDAALASLADRNRG